MGAHKYSEALAIRMTVTREDKHAIRMAAATVDMSITEWVRYTVIQAARDLGKNS